MNRPMIFLHWDNKLKLPPASFPWKIKLSLQNVAILTFITSHYRDETSLLNCFGHIVEAKNLLQIKLGEMN